MEQQQLIMPQELKTVEIDVEKRVFNVNGKPFGKGSTGFTISCDSTDGYRIRMDIDTTVHFASYCMKDGKKQAESSYQLME